MRKLFWDHLIHFDELLHELKSLPFSSKEQEELIETIDSLFHHHILDEILSALPREEHDRLLRMLSERPDDEQILLYILRFVPDIEARIKHRSLQVTDIVRREILDARKRHLG
jgi:hypothetical protein